jgi:amino acid permease
VIDFVYSDDKKKKIDQNDPLTVKWRYICSAVLAVLSLPIIYQRSLGALRYIAMLIVVVISYTVVVTLAEFPAYYHHLKSDPKYQVEWVSKEFNVIWLQGWATMMLSYYSQILFFFVRAEMVSKTERRITKLINFLACALTSFFCIFSVVGYASLGDNYMPELFTLRRKLTDDSKDIFMTIAQVGFTLAAFSKISLILYPAREQVYIFYKLDRSFKTHFTITFIMTICAYGIPCIYPNVTNLLGLTGGILTGSLGYSIPLLLKLVSLKQKKQTKTLSFCFHTFLLILVLIIQCGGTYISIFGTN